MNFLMIKLKGKKNLVNKNKSIQVNLLNLQFE
jgi:hypothetical protein